MSPENPKIIILLATFNGVRFIDQQMTSLIGQANVEVQIHVNDDGSTDGTIERLEYWRRKGWISTLSHSRNIGATQAFLKLLNETHIDGPVAFCDQDDVWANDKLSCQLSVLEHIKPMVVFGKRQYIDSSNKSIGMSNDVLIEPNFLNALVENIIPGNTMLLNEKAVKLLKQFKNPKVSHYDSWTYLLVSAFGECKYVSNVLLQYRIHEKNLVGLRHYSLKDQISSVKNFGQQAIYFQNAVGLNLPTEATKELILFSSIFGTDNYLSKIRAVFKLKISRQRILDRLGFRCVLLIGVLAKKL